MAVPWKLKECVNILLPPGVNLAVSLRMLPPFRCALMPSNPPPALWLAPLVTPSVCIAGQPATLPALPFATQVTPSRSE
eukprot:775173-Pelagomonas_calceolata.AAC.6